MKLRRGKTKRILMSAIDAALLAVEIYNKPRTPFRSEAYITMMIIAWTRLFHAYFNAKIGDKYYYKKGSRYKRIDNEKKTWNLEKCIEKYDRLKEPVKKNIEFFIKIRNKVEHRHLESREIDVLIFGECQSLLYNFESTLISLFGEEYALNESLVFSLQLSHLRTSEQQGASKAALSKEIQDIFNYVKKYRISLSDEVFSSQEYSIKLLQVPKISNTNRSDLAVEFVPWDEERMKDKQNYQKIISIIKDKRTEVEAVNVGKLKPSAVVECVNKNIQGAKFTMYTHRCLYELFSIRPPGNSDNPSDTKTNFCHYDKAHKDYLYQDTWPELIIRLFQSGRASVPDIHAAWHNGEIWDVRDYIS